MIFNLGNSELVLIGVVAVFFVGMPILALLVARHESAKSKKANQE